MKHNIYVTTVAGDTYKTLPTPTELAVGIVASVDDPDRDRVMSFDTAGDVTRNYETSQVVIPFRSVASMVIQPPLWVAGRLDKVTPGAVFAVDAELSAAVTHIRVVEVTDEAVTWKPVAFRTGGAVLKGSTGRRSLREFARGISPTTADEVSDAGGKVLPEDHFPMWTDE